MTEEKPLLRDDIPTEADEQPFRDMRYACPSIEEIDASMEVILPQYKTFVPDFALKPWKDITYEPGAGNWLVHGLLPAEGLAIVFGKAKSFKSFFVLDLGVAIADERRDEWAGRKLKHGAVVYIVAEGRLGMRKRIEAYKRHRAGCDADLPFFIIEARPNLGTRPSDKEELIAVIRAALPDHPVVAIIIDTLARTLGGADENGEGMRNFADNAEDVAESFGCLAIAVHHEGHEGGRKRGHSSLGGANVASVQVTKTSKPGSGVYTADVVVEEAKDGEEGLAFVVTLKLVDIDDETTLLVDSVVEHDRTVAAPKAKAKTTRIPSGLQGFMRAFDIALDEHGLTERPHQDGPLLRVVSTKLLRTVYYSRRHGTGDAKRQAFNRNLDAAVDRELLFLKAIPGDEALLWRA